MTTAMYPSRATLLSFVITALLVLGPPALSASPATPPATTGVTATKAEEWKGKPYEHFHQVSVQSGLSLIGGRIGVGLVGAFSRKILNRGFFPDVTNQVHLEGLFGVSFLSTGEGFLYGLHLRWDFHKNDFWTFYSLGGFGGEITGPATGNITTFHPRFGVGAYWHVFEFISFRGEITSELTSIGISYNF